MKDLLKKLKFNMGHYTKIGLIIGGVVVVLLAGGFFIWKAGLVGDDTVDEFDFEDAVDVIVDEDQDIAPLKNEEVIPVGEVVEYENIEEEERKQIARVFVESWGSLDSSQFYRGLDMASVYGTASMQEFLRQEKVRLSESGVETHVITSVFGLSVEESDDDRMVVVVSARRNDVIKNSTYKQKARVTMVDVNGEWRVQRAEWFEKTF